MNGGIFPNLKIWQKALIACALIFALIIMFSYLQSSHEEHSDILMQTYLSTEEEETEETFYPIDELPLKENAPAAKTEEKPKEKKVEKPVAPRTVAKSVERKGAWSIQIASFRDSKKANVLVSQLSKQGYPAAVQTQNLAEKGVWHRVQVGQFDSKEKAKSTLDALKSKYKGSFFVKR